MGVAALGPCEALPRPVRETADTGKRAASRAKALISNWSWLQRHSDGSIGLTQATKAPDFPPRHLARSQGRGALMM